MKVRWKWYFRAVGVVVMIFPIVIDAVSMNVNPNPHLSLSSLHPPQAKHHSHQSYVHCPPATLPGSTFLHKTLLRPAKQKLIPTPRTFSPLSLQQTTYSHAAPAAKLYPESHYGCFILSF